MGIMLWRHLVYLGKTGNLLHHHGIKLQILKTSNYVEL
jgi:hypothetical protein